MRIGFPLLIKKSIADSRTEFDDQIPVSAQIDLTWACAAKPIRKPASPWTLGTHVIVQLRDLSTSTPAAVSSPMSDDRKSKRAVCDLIRHRSS